MKVFEDIVFDEQDYRCTGFINTNYDLEFSIHKHVDGGVVELTDEKYTEEKLLGLLSDELSAYINNQKSVIRILGHQIRIMRKDDSLIEYDNLNDEIYEISQAILDGFEFGEVYIKSLKELVVWSIVG